MRAYSFRYLGLRPRLFTFGSGSRIARSVWPNSGDCSGAAFATVLALVIGGAVFGFTGRRKLAAFFDVVLFVLVCMITSCLLSLKCNARRQTDRRRRPAANRSCRALGCRSLNILRSGPWIFFSGCLAQRDEAVRS